MPMFLVLNWNRRASRLRSPRGIPTFRAGADLHQGANRNRKRACWVYIVGTGERLPCDPRAASGRCLGL